MVQEVSSLKEEFEAFAKKVAALESIKQELDTIDVTGFESEAKFIKNNIKNIDAIPDLTERLANLKVKIAHKNDRVPDEFSREVHEARASKVLEGEIFRLNEKIEDLEAEIRKKNSDLAVVKEIPGLHKELSYLRQQLDNYINLSKNVRPSESNLSSLSQISPQLVENLFVKKYNELLTNLNKKYEDAVERELRGHFDAAIEKHLAQEREKIIQVLTNQIGIGKTNILSSDNLSSVNKDKNVQRESLPFLRVEKFNAGKSALFKAKEILNTFSRPLSRIKDIKFKEEQEFILWERDIYSLQSDMNEVSSKIYEYVKEN